MSTINTDRVRRNVTSAAPASARSVEAVHRSTSFHWVGDGFFVATYFPSEALPAERVSPFLLMDYGPERRFAPLARGKRGVGWHPHRGFETVTLAWAGAVAHRDNAGHAGVIGPGDAQWMTAASGIFHEEYHEEEFARRGGPFHMMQLWVNLPRKHKAAAPGYQPLQASQIPNVLLPGGGHARVLAGEYEGTRGPAKTFTPITMLDARLNAGERLSVPLPASYNALAVVADGSVSAGGVQAASGELLLFANDGRRLELEAQREAHVIVLAGEPIDEPIVQYGPFVMNTVDEIRQAMLDVQSGEFGPIPD
ncbi:MAG TPA: pirin family protein [Polyangiaceae bacterium]|jgi:redox-sensitive bicupin YhaK (pirin superfamily)|nr:pirin family protein [Polyangiaceae bacterium]